jgi:hypothetical protein
MAYVQTIFPGFVPDGFFYDDNIEFIRNKVAEVLGWEFVQTIVMDRASVIRVMQRVLEERLESIPFMNQRVIMYLCSEYRWHSYTTRKHLNWEEKYIESQRLYDPTVERGPDLQIIKLANRLGQPKIGDTVRFVFM